MAILELGYREGLRSLIQGTKGLFHLENINFVKFAP